MFQLFAVPTAGEPCVGEGAVVVKVVRNIDPMCAERPGSLRLLDNPFEDTIIPFVFSQLNEVHLYRGGCQPAPNLWHNGIRAECESLVIVWAVLELVILSDESVDDLLDHLGIVSSLSESFGSFRIVTPYTLDDL